MPLDPNRKPTPPRKGPRCTVCTALHLLDRNDADVLQGWLDHPVLTASQLVEWLRADGIEYVSETAVSRHRRRACVEMRRGTV